MLSKQEEEAERRAVLENDRRVREQQQQRGSTFHAYAAAAANDDAGGRWAIVNAVTVVGSDPAVRYPAASAHQRDPVPTEPPLGYSVDQVEPIEPSTGSSSLAAVEETGGAPSVPPDVAASPPSSSVGDPDGFVCQPYQPVHDERA